MLRVDFHRVGYKPSPLGGKVISKLFPLHTQCAYNIFPKITQKGKQIGRESYRRGAHTVTDFKYHFVWKTKYSDGVLKGEIGLRMRDIIREISAENSLNIIKGNVRSNHVHVLVTAPSHLSPAKIMQYLKGKSSYRLQREFSQLSKGNTQLTIILRCISTIFFLVSHNHGDKLSIIISDGLISSLNSSLLNNE